METESYQNEEGYSSSEYENEFEVPEVQTDPEAVLTDNGINEIISKYGGRHEDWDCTFESPIGSMRYDSSKREILDNKGNSITAMLKAHGKPEQVAIHMGLIAGLESKPGQVHLIDYVDEGKQNVMAIKLEAGGNLNSRTWTREQNTETPLPSIEDLSELMDKNTENNDERHDSSDENPEPIVLDLNQAMMDTERAETTVEVEDNSNLEEKDKPAQKVVIIDLDPIDTRPTSVSFDDPSLEEVVANELPDEIEDIVIKRAA